MHVSELQTQHISKLLEMAEQHGIENANRLRKQDLVFAIVRQMMKQGESFTCSAAASAPCWWRRRKPVKP